MSSPYSKNIKKRSDKDIPTYISWYGNNCGYIPINLLESIIGRLIGCLGDNKKDCGIDKKTKVCILASQILNENNVKGNK